MATKLLFLLLVTTFLLLGSGSSTLTLNATGPTSTIRRSESKVNVFLRVETDDEGRNVDYLLSDADMSLPDQHTGMMDGFSQTTLENLSLQPSLQEIFNLECQHVIETHAGLVQHTDAHETADEGVTLEETFGVLVVELEELTGGTTDFGEDEGDTPDLAFVAEAVFTCELQLGIETSGFKRSTGDLISLGMVPRGPGHFLDLEDVGESDQPIPLPNVSASVLRKVLEYCEHHRGEPLPAADADSNQDEARKRTTDIGEWDQKFITVDQEMLFEIILAANYLDIKPLLDVGCKTVANMIKGKSPEEIRKLFNIVNDFTPEEEAQIKKENEWAEDR